MSDIAKILIVDDKPENLQVMKRILVDLSAELYLVDSGEKALQFITRHTFALAILDVQMPIMNGFELAELMRSNVESKLIPIIFVTAISKDDKYVKQGYYVGAVDYLFKPFDPDLLIAKAKIFLELYQQKLQAKNIEERQHFILNEVADGWWEWLMGTEHFFYNDKFKKHLGYNPSELKNTLSAWQDLVDQDDLQKNNKTLKAYINQKKPYQITLRFRHKEGHVLWIYCKGVMINDLDANNMRMIGTYTDITPLKELEQTLRKSNQDLEQFAYITSHDLRAPLRAIEKLSEWISSSKENTLSEASKEYFNKLISRVHRMDNLINGILSYSKLGANAEKKEMINLSKVLTNTIELLQPPENCSISIPRQLPDICGEKTQIAQVFSNLINNAIKYSDKDEIKIKISYLEEKRYYLFLIEDNGPGIDEQYHEQVFTMFQTLQPRDKIESTGVGLTLVKKIVELNGGMIWIGNELTTGTIFKFTWPKNRISLGL